MKETKPLVNLKRFREEKGITQEQMAELLGYSVSGYRKIEQGERKLSIDLGKEIGGILGKTLDEIFLSS